MVEVEEGPTAVSDKVFPPCIDPCQQVSEWRLRLRDAQGSLWPLADQGLGQAAHAGGLVASSQLVKAGALRRRPCTLWKQPPRMQPVLAVWQLQASCLEQGWLNPKP